MKKATRKTRSATEQDMPAEYPTGFFRSGIRGKYLAAYRGGPGKKSCVTVALEPDVAKEFPTAAAVNEALRLVKRLKGIGRPAGDARRKSA